MTPDTDAAPAPERAIEAETGERFPTAADAWDHAYAAAWSPSAGAARVMGTSRQQRRLALATAAAFALLTLALLPFATRTGPALPGFVPAYQMAVFLFYALSTIHLFNHFRRTGLIALLHLGAGCLFSAMMLLVQLFSFPIWGPHQLVGSTAATTTWLWTFWHLGPVVFSLTYLVAAGRTGALAALPPARDPAPLVLRATAVALGLAALATGLSTWGLPSLPSISQEGDYHRLVTSGVGIGVLLLSIMAVGLLIWRTRCASTVELCLALALALLICDDALTLAGSARLSLGWYAGRAEAAVSAAILLGFYVMEIDRRYARVTAQAQMLAQDRTMLGEIVTEQRHANAALLLLAREDVLTGLANRRRFDEQLRQEWLRAYREGQTLTLLMLDVDHFKKFNDHYGHQSGDRCLRTIAGLMLEVGQRPADLSARYGGEEFVLLLPNSDAAGGLTAANALLDRLEREDLAHASAPLGRVTLSIGVAACAPLHDRASSPDALVAAADAALYEAKRGGRNQARSARIAAPLAHAEDVRMPSVQQVGLLTDDPVP